MLLQELRLQAARTVYARAQVSTLRERLLKIGVQVVAGVRRLVLHLPQAFADAHAQATGARRLGAATFFTRRAPGRRVRLGSVSVDVPDQPRPRSL